MADETHPKTLQRHHAIKALAEWLDERGIKSPLRGRIIEIDVWLDLFDDPKVRRYALNEMELGFRARRDDWGRSGLHALAIWRLYQQLVHCDSAFALKRACDAAAHA